jgi:aryl-phospho-beta-D-glucosidase BglC (GH1 family)
MATVFESLSLKGLRLVHLRQLRDYILMNKRHSYYYGPQKDYLKREQELEEWLDDAIEYAEQNGVKFPKGD